MIDLHMHSCYSDDGQYTPEELVDLCYTQGIRIMSVTDHNCTRANIEAQAAASKKGIGYIPGTEVDCIYENVNFHVLGYGIDYKNRDFERIEENIRVQSLQVSLERLEKTQALGFHVTKEDMRDISKGSFCEDIWTGEMFAEVLLSKQEYKEHPLLRPYRTGGTRSDNPYVNFYWDYYAQGKPCSVEMHYPSMEEVIDIIHRNHGIAVLAHPGKNLEQKEYLMEGILALGIDGIEVFSSYHTPGQMEQYYETARDNKLLVTCGSDYHGKTKPSVNLGGHGCIITDEEMKRILSEHGINLK